MSLSNSFSQKLLRNDKSQFLYRPQSFKTQSNIKKASTFPAHQPLDIQLYTISQDQVSSNPFLKARVKAYLKDLDKSVAVKQPKKIDQSPDQQSNLPVEERVTLKKMKQIRGNLNQSTAEQIKKKLIINQSLKRY